jgi:hypothetical protein
MESDEEETASMAEEASEDEEPTSNDPDISPEEAQRQLNQVLKDGQEGMTVICFKNIRAHWQYHAKGLFTKQQALLQVRFLIIYSILISFSVQPPRVLFST